MAIQYRLEQRPESGTPPKWSRSNDILPALKEGEARLSLDYISIDPGMMGWVTVSALIASGDLVVQEHILEGIDAFPDGFDMIFKGGNLGKLMIKV